MHRANSFIIFFDQTSTSMVTLFINNIKYFFFIFFYKKNHLNY